MRNRPIKHVIKFIGLLRKNTKTNPRSPDLTGKVPLQRDTFEKIARHFKESGDDSVECPIAGWRNRDKDGDQYLTVEFSPPYVPPPHPEPDFEFDHFFADELEDEE